MAIARRRYLNRPSPGGATWLAGIGGLVLLILVIVAAVFLIGRFTDDEVLAPGPATTVSEIAADPSRFYGKNVSVSGEISEVLDVHAYTLGGRAFADGAELLVIGPPPAVIADQVQEPTVYAGDLALVSGEVRPFEELPAVEEEIGLDLDREAIQRFTGQPLLVANSTALTPRVRPAVDTNAPISVADLIDDPSGYYDETVTVNSEVTEVLSSNLFVLGGGGLVVDATEAVAGTALQESETVQVSGPIRRFDAESVRAESGVDVEDNLAAEFAGRPVLIAQVVHVFP